MTSPEDAVTTEVGRRRLSDVRAAFAARGLTRSRDEMVFGGVCAGLGRRVGLAPWPARLVFLLVLMLIPGSQLLVYPLLWVLMPLQDTTGLAARKPTAA